MAKFAITLDTHKGPHGGEPVRVRVGDKESCDIAATVTEGGRKKDLAGMRARFECLKPDGTRVLDTQCRVTEAESLVDYSLAPQVSAAPGEISLAYFSLADADGNKVDSTQSFVIVVERGVGDIGSTDYINEVDAIIRLLESQRQAYEEAEAARASAEKARAAAEKSRESSESQRASAESARRSAEEERARDEETRRSDESGRVRAESARSAAEGEREKAEGSRASAERLRAESERERASAESARTSSESSRTSAEGARAAAEKARATAEGARSSAEAERSASEGQRKAAETERGRAEEARASSEELRKAEESKRAEAERARSVAETARVDAEGKRAAAEQKRATAESARAASQEANDTAQAKNNADQAANNAAALGLTFVVLKEGQYDPSSLEPTVSGENGKMYLVPDPKGSADNVYREWIWTGEWECIGSSATSFDAITTDTIDAIASGRSPSGDEGLSTTGLSYLWAKLKAAFAQAAHKHAKADITDFPASMPASDVKAWAKAATKPSYTAAEVGAAAASHKHAQGDVTGLPDALAALQPRATYAVVTIQTGEWEQLNATKQVEGATPDAVIRCGAAPSSEIAASAAHVYCSAQGQGTLTFSCASVPAAAVELNIEIREA